MLPILCNGTSLAVSQWKLRMVLTCVWLGTDPAANLCYLWCFLPLENCFSLIVLAVMSLLLREILLSIWRGYVVSWLIDKQFFSVSNCLAFLCLTRKTVNLIVFPTPHFGACLCCLRLSANLLAPRELFVSDFIGSGGFNRGCYSILFTCMTSVWPQSLNE